MSSHLQCTCMDGHGDEGFENYAPSDLFFFFLLLKCLNGDYKKNLPKTVKDKDTTFGIGDLSIPDWWKL